MSEVQQPLGAAIDKMAEAMRHMPQWDAEQYTGHHFADGQYLRTLWIPKGAVIVGRVHKSQHFFILSVGEMTLWTDEGMRHVVAPFVCVSSPGTRRVGFAHEDSMVINVHRTDATTLEAIEDELIEKDERALFGVGNVLLDRLLEVTP